MLITCPIHTTKRDSPCVYHENQIFSYEQINHKVACITQGLENLGVQKDSCVAFAAKSSLEVICLLFALARRKAVGAILSPFLKKEALEEQLQRLENPLFLDESLLQKLFHSCVPSLEVEIEPRAPWIQLFTSGSSGNPKIAVLSFANFYFSALGSNEALEMDKADNWLLSLPLFHVSGISILFRSLLSLSSITLSDKPLQEALSCFPITRISLVPTQLFRLLETKDAQLVKRLASLKTILLGGASLSESLWHQAKNLNLPIRMSWGLTEMASHVTLEKKEATIPSSGSPTTFRELKISEDGEILVRGETLFLGYFSKEGISNPLNQEGWFATKDLGHLDAENNLQFLGRKDAMFTSGGENIFPEEIEKVLKSLRGIVNAYVVPVEDSEWGNLPVAFLEGEWEDAAVIHELQKHFSSLKIPKRFFQLGDNSGLKHSRKALALQAEALYKASQTAALSLK